MGKTLQTIALLLASPAVGPTLVVCPAAAMLQWRNEIARFAAPGPGLGTWRRQEPFFDVGMQLGT
jgi:SNF2 family DNA or RNA helicase